MSSLKPTTELTTAINDTRKPGTLKNFEKIKMRVTKKTNAESTTSSLSKSNNCLLNDGALKTSRSEGPKKVVKRGIENTERIASWKTSSEHNQKPSEEISIDQTKEVELTSKSASLKRKTMATAKKPSEEISIDQTRDTELTSKSASLKRKTMATEKKEDNACETESSHTSNISDMKEQANGNILLKKKKACAKKEPANKYGLFQRKSLRKRLNVVAQKVDLGQVDEDEVLHVECITVLRNGHCPDVKPTVIDGDNILLNNTCAFDCFVQMLCVSGCESAVCRKFFEVNEYESDLCKLICIMLRTGVNVSVYNLRAKILSLVFDAKISSHRMCHVNAVCSISFQVEAVWFFSDSPRIINLLV